ncbi:RNA polymerase sigma factor [Litchfieldia alkalitelluris]|uniref:RNA polymerase sigma factor n=1 Tax=Litchfieldia alkalitelluris TaxID=304268 RepID=UPI00099679A4|nr:sigma-70 family RNA polymerase sigma factor [Litchfieldia alkalitelluris]
MELEEVYKNVSPRIFAYFYAKTLAKEIAEDLTHDVFYDAMKNIHSFSGKSSIDTWIFAIAMNRLKKYYRSKKYKKQLQQKLIFDDANTVSIIDEMIEKENHQLLLEKIRLLEEPLKELVTLRIYGELSFKEIGIILNKTENYARVNFYRTKLKLQKELEEGKNEHKS